MAMAISGVREDGVNGARLKLFEQQVTYRMGRAMSGILVQFRYAEKDRGLGVRVRVYAKNWQAVTADIRIRFRDGIQDHLPPELLNSFGLQIVPWDDWDGSP